MSRHRPTRWEDWLKDARACERSIRHYGSRRMSLIDVLPHRIAKENVLGHLRKAYHNLDLANGIYEIHEGRREFRYEGENFFDWVAN